MKKLRPIFAFLLVLASFPFFPPIGSAEAVKPAAIFYSPHQDDELLSMGLGIVTSLAQGYDVHLVLMTDGGAADGALNLVNQRLTQEKYPKINREDFISARTNEFLRSAAILGVKAENIHLMNYPDGQLTYAEAKQTIVSFEKNTPMRYINRCLL